MYDKSEQRQAYYRDKFQIDPNRRVFTLLGVLDRRKGVKELLQYLSLIPDEAASKICILLSGVVNPGLREAVFALVEKVKAETKVQVILNNDYLPDRDVQHVYDLSDVILATYQGHMGSSSALIRAALAGKPVLSADYGLMGAIVRKRRLGRLVDTTNPQAVADELAALAVEPNLNDVFDPAEAQRYAQENTPARLASDLAVMVTGDPK
jgi:glycosyltransferase involved in cell wall biosynthesis